MKTKKCKYDCTLENTLACRYCMCNPDGVYKDEKFSYKLCTEDCETDIIELKKGVVPYWKFNTK